MTSTLEPFDWETELFNYFLAPWIRTSVGWVYANDGYYEDSGQQWQQFSQPVQMWYGQGWLQADHYPYLPLHVRVHWEMDNGWIVGEWIETSMTFGWLWLSTYQVWTEYPPANRSYYADLRPETQPAPNDVYPKGSLEIHDSATSGWQLILTTDPFHTEYYESGESRGHRYSVCVVDFNSIPEEGRRPESDDSYANSGYQVNFRMAGGFPTAGYPWTGNVIATDQDSRGEGDPDRWVMLPDEAAEVVNSYKVNLYVILPPATADFVETSSYTVGTEERSYLAPHQALTYPDVMGNARLIHQFPLKWNYYSGSNTDREELYQFTDPDPSEGEYLHVLADDELDPGGFAMFAAVISDLVPPPRADSSVSQDPPGLSIFRMGVMSRISVDAELIWVGKIRAVVNGFEDMV